MTDYGKHYCKSCMCWIKNDKMSIRKHEQGKKHLEIRQNQSKMKRDMEKKKEIQDKELEKELLKIEQEAYQRYAQDMMPNLKDTNGIAKSLLPHAPPPPPPPSTLPPATVLASNIVSKDILSASIRQIERNENNIIDENDEFKGIYAIRGRVYLDGKYHEKYIMIGSECDIWLDEFEEWIPCTIVEIDDLLVPNTTIVVRKFKVVFVNPKNNLEKIEKINIMGSSLRLKYPENYTLEQVKEYFRQTDDNNGFEQSTILKNNYYQNIEINENTGIGEWTTVSIDDIKEENQNDKNKCKDITQNDYNTSNLNDKMNDYKDNSEKKENENQVEEEEEEDNLLDPNTGTYKGIKINNLEEFEDEKNEINNTQFKKVSFKKRKMKCSDIKKRKR